MARTSNGSVSKNKNLKDKLVTAKLKTTQHDTIPKQQEDN